MFPSWNNDHAYDLEPREFVCGYCGETRVEGEPGFNAEREMCFRCIDLERYGETDLNRDGRLIG